MHSRFEYTINSTDEDHYNQIFINLQGPLTQLCNLTVTSLTANCSIVVLQADDYLTINGHKFTFDDDYTNLNPDTFADLLNKKIATPFSLLTVPIKFKFSTDYCKRINISCENDEIHITDCSYNVALLLGLNREKLPLSGTKLYIEIAMDSVPDILVMKNVGMTLSTPILYLLSNIGYNSFKNGVNHKTLSSARIVMRLNNAYTPSMPILAANGDFTSVCNTNDLADLRLTLVDANLHEIRLLNPMYVTLTAEPIPDSLFGLLFMSGEDRVKKGEN
jgi:hypothetical protein